MNGNGEHTNSRITTNSELKISDEFFKILQENTFNGIDEEDVIDHIAKVLKITEWIKMPNVEKNELQLHVFSKSLSGDVQAKLISLKELLAACLASTMNSSTEKITDGRTLLKL
ncbi:hypothetical protein Tco_0072961 [Tanacetum coccineum]